jgi:hypothetical protein
MSMSKKSVTKVKPPTPALAAKIKSLHQAACHAAGTAIDSALQCGALLIEAKDKVKHGEWPPWLEENTTISARQAQKYMRLAEHKREVKAGKYARFAFADQ